MPTIKIEQSLLTRLQLRHGIEHQPSRIAEELPLLGTDIDLCDDSMLEIEIFPDRPDLLSAETLAHAIRPFMYGTDSVPELNIATGDITMSVDQSLENVRPIILGAVVRGVETGETAAEKEQFIKGLMEHQEKLHFALGRGRRRASIGVHDLSTLAPPFNVKTVRRDYKFIPLAMRQEMSIDEILTEHPKGVDYAHLLEGMEQVPIILDSDNKVLSFPPIINGEHTTVTDYTTDFFIDVTGWDDRACSACLQLVCLQLEAHGGQIENVQLTSCLGEQFTSPRSGCIPHSVEKQLVRDILGWEFSETEIHAAINRMGGKYSGGQETLEILMPRWRFDILHPIDIVEDLAIGHGYDNLGSAEPNTSMSGQPRKDANISRRVRQSMQGLGLQQVQSLTLSNENDQFTAVGWEPAGEVTIIANPITIEHTLLRQNILPSLLRLIATNRHHELPQSIFEVGYCVRDHQNVAKASWLVADREAGFAKARGFAQALLRDLGAKPEFVEWHDISNGSGPWLSGRGAKISVSGNYVGEFGELDPVVSEQFDLNVPMHGGEFDLSALMAAIPDPVL